MLIQVNTDSNVVAGEELRAEIDSVVTHALAHVSEHVSRVEVHLSDEDGPGRAQGDQRCMMEARVEGRQPVAVTHHASGRHDAIDGAAEKLKRLLEHTLGKSKDHHHPVAS